MQNDSLRSLRRFNDSLMSIQFFSVPIIKIIGTEKNCPAGEKSFNGSAVPKGFGHGTKHLACRTDFERV